MKKLLLTAVAILFVSLSMLAQSSKIEGKWYTDDKETVIEITKQSDGTYDGTIVWLMEPNEDNGKPKIDDENPDPQLAKRPIMGLTMVKDFKYNSKKEQWSEGRIYDPGNGKTYDCYSWFEDGDTNKLYIKGYVAGIKALGRKTIWTRK